MTTPAPRGGKRQQVDEMVTYAVRLLSRRAYKHEIFAILKKRYSCSARTCERIMARAREELRARYGKKVAGHRCDAYAFYDSVIRDPESSLSEKLHAQSRIDALLGLQAPQEHRLGQSKGADPVHIIETVVTTREEASAFLSGSAAPGPEIVS